jgi:hypothetical protein
LYEGFKSDALVRGAVTGVTLVTLLSSYKFILAVSIWTDMLRCLNLVSKCFQRSHVRYSEFREIINAVKVGSAGTCSEREGSEDVVLTDSDRIQKWVEGNTHVCVEYSCEKTHPHYLRADPDALYYYHGPATRVVHGGVEVFFGGDPTAESTQVFSIDQMTTGVDTFKLCVCKDLHHMRTAKSTRPSFQYDGIDFKFDEDNHD